jgi:hypothetical protein
MIGRGRGGPPDAWPPLLWSLLVIAAALIGGLVATALVRVSLAAALGVSVVVGIIVALGAARRPRRPANQPQVRSAPGGLAGAHAESGDAVSAETVVQLLPMSPMQDWWHAAQEMGPAPDLAARRGSDSDLSAYLASTIIAQCPNCGAFSLDFRRAKNGWNFRCEACGYTWIWRPDTSWPPVRVAPRRRKQLYGNERQRLCMREISAAGIRAAWCSCSTGPIR